MQTEWTSTHTPDGEMRLYLARPDGAGPHAAVVVIHEGAGLTEHIRDVTARLAREGFVAVAPDLFHRFDQSPLASGDPQDAAKVARQLTREQALADVGAACAWLAAHPEADAARVGIVGFCLGGRIAFLAAAHEPRVRAAVSFYGGAIVTDAPDAPVHSSAQVHAPLLLFYGAKDAWVPVAHAGVVDEALARHGKPHEVVVYPNAGHGFMRDTTPEFYEPEAARDAWARTCAFFAEQLRA